MQYFGGARVLLVTTNEYGISYGIGW
jgi:hypothetical protein